MPLAATRRVMEMAERTTEMADRLVELQGRLGRYVAAYVRRRVRGSVVDDVVAEVWAIAWRRLDEVPANALPWLYAVARNVIGTQLRSASRWAARIERATVAGAGSADVVDIAEDVARRLEVDAALATLIDSDRELLLLVAWEGLSPADVAATLGVSAGTVSVRLHRARARLRAALEAGAVEAV
jgi:RNA polymerase sigma-70 factor (ECF subfamily)